MAPTTFVPTGAGPWQPPTWWWVVDATDTDAVDPDPERLWVAVLRRQPGELAWFAGYPDDASVN